MRALLFLYLRLLKIRQSLLCFLSGKKAENIHSDRIISGKTWEDFCDKLKLAGSIERRAKP
jgi:hypothetical protein